MAARGDRCACTVQSPRELPRERLRAHDPTDSRAAVYRRAKQDLDALAGTADEALYTEAELYVTRYPRHAPDAFSDSPRRRRMRAARALAPGGWAERLLGSIEAPHGYSLHSGHLQLPAEAADPERLNDPDNVALWVSAIRRELRGPLYYKLELGEGERVHAHVIAAHDAGLLQLPRDGEIVQPLYDPPGWIAYLMKPPAPYTGTNLGRWMIARRRGRLPRLSGIVNVPSRRVWGCEGDPSTLRVSLPLTRPSTPSAPAPDPDRSPILTAEAPALIVNTAPSMLERPDPSDDQDQIRSIRSVEPKRAELETTGESPRLDRLKGRDGRERPRTVSRPAPLSLEPDPDLIDPPRCHSASEAGCVSVTMFPPFGSIPDPVYPGRLSSSGPGCPISAESATATKPVRDAKNAPEQLACAWSKAAKIDLIRGDRTKTRVYPVRDGVYGVIDLPKSYPRRVKISRRGRKSRSAPSSAAHLLKQGRTRAVLRGRSRQRPAARGPPLRRAESRFKRPARSATRTSALSARAGNPPRSVNARGLLAPRMEVFRDATPQQSPRNPRRRPIRLPGQPLGAPTPGTTSDGDRCPQQRSRRAHHSRERRSVRHAATRAGGRIMPDDPTPPSKGLRDIDPHAAGEADQLSHGALTEAATAFGADPEQLEEMQNDATSKG